MKKYEVNIPIAGYVSVLVDAEDKEGAKDAAFEKVEFQLVCASGTECVELDTYSKITQGNVCYAPLHQIEIHEAEEQ